MGILGMFKKEKRLLEKTKEVSIQDIENWLENFVETSGLDSKIGVLKRDISSKVTRLNELLTDLEHAKIKEEKVIPDRLKSIFEGNRKAFLEKVRAFITELKVPEKREEIDEFLERISEKLNILSEDTQKNYFVLKEFVEDHVRPVTSKIKDIDAMISNARSEFDKTNLSKIKEIRAHHKKYNFIMDEIEKLNEELKHTIKMKESELERKSKFDSKIEEFKNTKAYEEYKQLQAREIALKESLVKAEKEIKELFSKLEYVLRKRHKVTGHNLLEKYASSPVDALTEDASFFISEELRNIKNNLKDLALKKEKRDAVFESLEDAGDQKIIALRKNLVSLRDELEMVIIRLKDNHYERSLKERENWVESVNKNIEAIEKKQQDIEDLIERMNPKYVKQKIKDLLKLIDESVELK
jgi:DNA repair exonuclease SbcCD ATPase subunit